MDAAAMGNGWDVPMQLGGRFSFFIFHGDYDWSPTPTAHIVPVAPPGLSSSVESNGRGVGKSGVQ